MRSTPSLAFRVSALLALGTLFLGPAMSQAQTTYVPGGPSTGSWGGYAPGYSWAPYGPGSAWVPYVPGTPVSPSVAVQPQPPQPFGLTPATQPLVVTAPGQPVYRTVPATSGRALINGVRNPVRGPTPYADGRARNYYEYGSGRNVPLAKPWLPGAPGG